jgi:transposase
MIDEQTCATIRHLFYAEHWKIGTIAHELGLHPETVSRAVETERFKNNKPGRARATDPYNDFIRETLGKYPRLRATRIFQMIRDRGYVGGVVQLRRVIAGLRPSLKEPFLYLRFFPGEQGQVDWAHFGEVSVVSPCVEKGSTLRRMKGDQS